MPKWFTDSLDIFPPYQLCLLSPILLKKSRPAEGRNSKSESVVIQTIWK